MTIKEMIEELTEIMEEAHKEIDNFLELRGHGIDNDDFDAIQLHNKITEIKSIVEELEGMRG